MSEEFKGELAKFIVACSFITMGMFTILRQSPVSGAYESEVKQVANIPVKHRESRAKQKTPGIPGKLPIAEPYEPTEIPEMIQYYGKEAGLQAWEIAKFECIAHRESTMRADAQNSRSSAAGLMQIVRGTWEAYSDLPFDEYKYQPKENIKTAIAIYQDLGFGQWVVCN